MPSSEEILSGLRVIANDWQLLSILWHGYFAVLILGIVFGMRPSRRIVATLLALPLLSVSLLAWTYSNPFNGTLFAITSIILLVIAARFSSHGISIAPAWATTLGVVMIGFGWIYPHFLNNASPIDYLYAAPTGVIPCPTLAIVIGFSLILGGFGSRLWCIALTVMGLFYSLFGYFQLGVKIDGVLLLGALAMAYTTLLIFFKEATWQK